MLVRGFGNLPFERPNAMSAIGWLQIALLFGAVLVCAVSLRAFMARVFAGERNILSPVLGPVERGYPADCTSGAATIDWLPPARRA
jgi:K+-transporting ATPase ATPase A chain